MYRLRWAVYLLTMVSAAADAHEFWIEPSRFRIAPSDAIVADLRVGQYFKGNSQVLAPYKFVSFRVIDPAGSRPISGRLGDIPAVDVATRKPGLHVLAYRSTATSTTYVDFEKFQSVARNEGVDWVIDEHQRRGLPQTEIKEAYTRYAKTLIQVGDGGGRDRALGMPLELVAETNPYDGLPGGTVMVRLLWRDRGHGDAQITVFRKLAGCEATRSTVRTDAEGRAAIPVGPGGRILLNAVHMMEPSARIREQMRDVHWESQWASLTYGLPEQVGGDPDCERIDNSHRERR